MQSFLSFIPTICTLLIVLLLSACSVQRHSLSEPIQPLPNIEGAVKASASVGGFSDANMASNLQVAYSSPRKFSGGLNLYMVGPEINNNVENNYAKSWVGEAYVGKYWFKPLQINVEGTTEKTSSPYNGILFDVSTGYGFSNLTSKSSGTNNNSFPAVEYNGEISYFTQHIFIQTGLLVKSKWVDVGMSLKGIGLDYISGEQNGQRFTNSQENFNSQAKDGNGFFTYLETGFRFSAGSPKVRAFTTVSVVSHVFGDKQMITLPKPLMIGLELNLNEFGKKD